MTKNILLVDDEELVLESLKRLLKKEGYAVTTAMNGDEAMKWIKEINFDLLVTDIRMPGTDGVEIVKNVRGYLKQQNKPYVPEILITGYSSEETFKKVQELKVADYIYKPFDINVFLEVVRRNLK